MHGTIAVSHVSRGRPRKPNVVRDRSGKSRGEIVDFTVVTNQPHRRGAKDPASQLLGYPLGRLRLSGQVSDAQLWVGNQWAAIVAAYGRMIGAPAVSPKSGEMAERISSGFYSWEGETLEIDPDESERRRQALRERYNECFEALMELGQVLGRGREIFLVLKRVCVEERYPNEHEIGDLRVGLNALERILRAGK